MLMKYIIYLISQDVVEEEQWRKQYMICCGATIVCSSLAAKR